MSTTLNKIASVLAFIIGAMAIFAGAKVLIGIDPGYNVINWLPLYNYTMGILTFFITAALLWANSRLSKPIAIGTFSLHSVVMLILQSAYRDVVASESIQAMTIRMFVWAIILTLMFFQWRKNQVATQPLFS